jgi:hypothetical protein
LVPGLNMPGMLFLIEIQQTSIKIQGKGGIHIDPTDPDLHEEMSDQ